MSTSRGEGGGSGLAPAEELLEFGDAFVEVSRDWRVLRVNANQERLSQIPRSESVGRVFWEVWPLQPDSRYWHEYHRCMEERVPVQFEDYFAPLDLWTGVTAYPIGTGGIAIFFRDITARKRAEQLLRVQRDFGDAVLDTIANLVVVLDPEARIVRFNAACERVTGYSAGEALGRSVFELLIPEADLAGTTATFARLRMGDFPNEHRNRWRTKDGSERLIAWSNTAVADDRGAVAFIIATGVDVTQCEETLEALRESNERFRSVFDCAAVGVGRVGLDGRFLEVNEAYARLVGYTREELLRRDFQTITHPEDLAADVERFADLLDGRVASYRMDKRYVRSDGSLVWVSLSVGLARDSAGRPAYCSVVAEDITARKRADAALAEALARAEEERRRLAAVLDALPAGVVITDAKGGFTEVNGEFKRIWGAPPTPRSADEYGAWRGWWPASGRAIEAREWALARALSTGEVIVPGDVVEIEKFDGSGRATIVNAAAPIRSATGEIVGGVLAEVDVTAQQRAEEALRSSEAMFRSVFEQAAIGMARVRFDDARWIDVNEAFCRMLGRSREELLATPWPEITHPDDVALDLVPFRRMAAGELDSYTVEKRFRHADGRLVWTKLTLSVVRRPDGAPDYEVAIIEDITDRKLAEEEVRRSEAALDAFFARSPGILNLEDEELRFVNTDPLTPTYFGLTRESIVGRSLHEIAPEMIAEYGPMMKEVIRTGEARLNVEVQGPVSGRPGETTHWRASYFPVPLPNGRRGIGVMGVDITDLKKAEDKLRDADRRKDEFLGMLSHELRNPLAPIRNALYILDHASPDGQQARRAKEVANRQLAQMTRLVDDLLDVTRIARGKIDLRCTDVDLGAVARRTAEDHRAVMHDRRLDLEVHVPDRPVIVSADETRLAQVLGNLLHNAAKFTPAGGRVTLSVTAGEDGAAVRVRDTGPGIAPDVLPTIFQPFTQGKQTLARSEGGLGLGLALVKGLVALHGGEVRAYSAGEGEGTEFVVTLPALPPRAPARVDETAEAARDPRPLRVLVIDDNHDAADTLAQLLEMRGHDVTAVYDAYEGLASIQDELPDVVLCDLGLPGMDGYEFARQLRAVAATHRVRLIALSGYAQPEDVRKAMTAGFDAHVAKPPDPSHIERLLA